MWITRWLFDRLDAAHETAVDVQEASVAVLQQELVHERERSHAVAQLLRGLLGDQATELAALRAVNGNLRSQITRLESQFEWARVRLNAVELERATFLQRLLGTAPLIPEIQGPMPRPVASASSVGDAFAKGFGLAGIFEDIGDKEAGQLGLGHDDEGNLTTT